MKKDEKIREILSILGLKEWKHPVSDANVRILLNYLFDTRLKEIMWSRNLNPKLEESVAYAKEMYDVAVV